MFPVNTWSKASLRHIEQNEKENKKKEGFWQVFTHAYFFLRSYELGTEMGHENPGKVSGILVGELCRHYGECA